MRKNMAAQSAGARSAPKKVLLYTSSPQDFMQPFCGHIQWTKQKRDYCQFDWFTSTFSRLHTWPGIIVILQH